MVKYFRGKKSDLGDYEERGRDTRDVLSDSRITLFVVYSLKGASVCSRTVISRVVIY